MLHVSLFNSKVHGVMRRGKNAEPFAAESRNDGRHWWFRATRPVSCQLCFPGYFSTVHIFSDVKLKLRLFFLDFYAYC